MNTRLPGRPVQVGLLVTLCSGLAACDEVSLPSSPEETITLGIVQIETVTPAPGTAFATAAGSQSFEQKVFYQRSDADFAANNQAPVFFWMETFDRRNNEWEWEGDIAVASRRLTSQIGMETLSGSFRIPRISPFCGPIDRLRAFTIVGVEVGNDGVSRLPKDNLSNKEGLSQNFNFENYAVTGAQPLSGPCIIELESVVESDFTFLWGEPVWVWGRRLPGVENPTIQFGGGEIIDFTLTNKGEDFGDWDLVTSWIPARAEAGAVSVAYSSGEASYGSDTPPVIDVDVEAGDYFEPNDDMSTASTDPLDWNVQVGWVVNPGLTIDDIDELPDSTANPLGLTAWGRGDWWRLDVPQTIDGTTACVDVLIFQENARGDDVDAFLFQGNFRFIDFDIDEGTSLTRVTGQPVATWNGEAVDPTMYLWVAPFSIESEISRYSLFAFNCSFLSQAAGTTAGLVLDSGPDGVRSRPVNRETAQAILRAKQAATLEGPVTAAARLGQIDQAALLQAARAMAVRPAFRTAAEVRLEQATAPVFLGASLGAPEARPGKRPAREGLHATPRR